MILRFKLYSIAGATALLSTPNVDAFSVQKSTRISTCNKSSSRLHQLNPDWDNNDFMAALGGGSEQIEKANADYQKQSDNRAALDEWRYNQAMAEQQGLPPPQQAPPPQSMPLQPPPQTGAPPPQQMQQPPAQFFDANGNPVTMPVVYDANGNPVPFNPAAVQQPPPQQPPQPVVPTFEPNLPNALEPPLPLNPKSASVEGRPTGFNSDAYTMSNTADVYFAQLKQDSKVRKIARLSGDRETSERVFGDDSIRQIKESFNQNPYTLDKNIAEAKADLEATVRMHQGEAQFGDRINPASSSGISYKEKLEQMKAKKRGGGVAVPPPVEAVKVEAPKVTAPPPPPPKVAAVAPPVTTTPPVTAALTQPAAVIATPATAMTATPAAATGATDEEDARRKVRTLQGLLLKQRGGPGFGAGRLRAPEAQRLEDTLEDVIGILRSEVGAKPSASVVDAVVESKPVVAQPIAATPPPPPQTTPAQAAAQAATTASVTTPAPPPPRPSMADPLAGSIACVEAVVNMYKASSPSEREQLLTPLRDALMAAASASNKNIAEGELDAHKKAMEAGPSATAAAAQPMMGFPTTYDVTKPDEVSVTESTTTAPSPIVATTETISTATSSNDQAENDKKLEEVYTALVNARDDSGTLGLKNMSGDEANDLADMLVTMRTVLLDELN